MGGRKQSACWHQRVLCARLASPKVAEVLGAVADGLLPLHEAGAEEVLGDALRLLGSKEIKVRVPARGARWLCGCGWPGVCMSSCACDRCRGLHA